MLTNITFRSIVPVVLNRLTLLLQSASSKDRIPSSLFDLELSAFGSELTEFHLSSGSEITSPWFVPDFMYVIFLNQWKIELCSLKSVGSNFGAPSTYATTCSSICSKGSKQCGEATAFLVNDPEALRNLISAWSPGVVPDSKRQRGWDLRRRCWCCCIARQCSRL